MRFSYAAFHFTFVLVAVSACVSALVAVSRFLLGRLPFHSKLVAVSWCSLGRTSLYSSLVAASRCSLGHGFAPRAPARCAGSICGTQNLGSMCKLASLKQAHCLIPNFSVPRARRSDWGANPWPTLHREYCWGDLLGRGDQCTKTWRYG
jgi:hypothetical protein